MKIKNLFMYFAACAVALTSCNKEDGPGIGGEEAENYSLYLKFEGLDGSTKADTDPIVDQTTATFTTGRMYFTKDNGDIVRKVEISNYAIPGAVTPQQLQDGKLFEDVDKDVAFVHVFGNHNFTSDYSNISQIETLTAGILSQTNSATWGVENANLYGRGPVLPAGSSAPAEADKEAIFTVTPLIARLEIGQILGSTNIVSFTVEDILIHNFYEEMTLTGALTTAKPNPWTVSTFPQDFPRYAPTTVTNGEYDPAWRKYLYDYGIQSPSAGSANAMIAAPDNGVWAYNVLANAGANPHIVIKLSNVGVAPGSAHDNGSGMYENSIAGDGIAYLTIIGYNKGSNVTDIQGGNIYKMQTLTFTDEDLGETPYPGDELLKLWVQVEIKKWTVVPVTPIFN